MSGVIPPPTDPNDRPRPEGHHGLVRRPRHRPGLILGKYGWTHPRRKLRKPYPLRFRKEMSSVERSTLILRPDPLDPGLLMSNPGWRAAIRKIIGREDLP